MYTSPVPRGLGWAGLSRARLVGNAWVRSCEGALAKAGNLAHAENGGSRRAVPWLPRES